MAPAGNKPVRVSPTAPTPLLGLGDIHARAPATLGGGRVTRAANQRSAQADGRRALGSSDPAIPPSWPGIFMGGRRSGPTISGRVVIRERKQSSLKVGNPLSRLCRPQVAA
jgi:hypothetical protein